MTFYARPAGSFADWLFTAVIVQLIIGVFASLSPQDLSPRYPPIEFYTILNLALTIGLAFSLSMGRHLTSRARIALGALAVGCGLLLSAELIGPSEEKELWLLVAWAFSLVALALLISTKATNNAVKVGLLVAIGAQGVSAIVANWTDNAGNDPWGTWLHVTSSALSMAIYQITLQYLIQSKGRVGAVTTHSEVGEKKGTLTPYLAWKYLLPKRLKKGVMIGWYNLVARLDSRGEVLFMNHGYAPSGDDRRTLSLPPELERVRYPIQLYDLLARKVEWTGKDALEVSSGLGGGASWIWTTYRPKSLVGLDIAAVAVRKSLAAFGRLGIEFRVGKAEAMPFRDQSFDIIINVESSLNYPDMALFLSEVKRLLRPGGHFLFVDYRQTAKITRLLRNLDGMGLVRVELEDITEGICRGLEQEDKRKLDLIRRRTPAFLRKVVTDFAGLGSVANSELSKFSDRRKTCILAVLRKPDGRGEADNAPTPALLR